MIPTEHDEQVRVVEYCDWMKIPIFAIPNGSNKSVQQRMKFKREGLRSGCPDLFIPVSKGGMHGLFVEMKRVKGSVTSQEQIAWHKLLIDQGYCVVIAKGADVAIEYISSYIKTETINV